MGFIICTRNIIDRMNSNESTIEYSTNRALSLIVGGDPWNFSNMMKKE